MALYGTLGYLLGHNLSLLHRILSALGIAGGVITALIAVALFIVWRRRRGRHSVEDDHNDSRTRMGA